jgi:hypothetical protein
MAPKRQNRSTADSREFEGLCVHAGFNTQAEAADALGLTLRVIGGYASGAMPIPILVMRHLRALVRYKIKRERLEERVPPPKKGD